MDYYNNNAVKITNPNDDGWIILEKQDFKIKSLIENNGIKLKEWNVEINYGFKTGFNIPFSFHKRREQN
ncbi:MAG: hypothetical protein IPH46_04045 [Bacteroidetes bacterium]|nr:hypothetical protein [Bacteroidota bacterium]